jgi:hypothetical protein
MPPTTLDTSNNILPVVASSGDMNDEEIDENEIEEKIHNLVQQKSASPTVPRNHEKVTRLSRWEGGNAFHKELYNKPACGKIDEEERKRQSDREYVSADNHSVKIRDIARVFRRSDALLAVEDEDVERVKIMHDTFLESSQFSFNYNVLLLVASILAGKFKGFW